MPEQLETTVARIEERIISLTNTIEKQQHEKRIAVLEHSKTALTTSARTIWTILGGIVVWLLVDLFHLR